MVVEGEDSALFLGFNFRLSCGAYLKNVINAVRGFLFRNQKFWSYCSKGSKS